MSRLNIFAAIQGKIDYYKSLDAKDKTTYWKETLINNALYILLIIAIFTPILRTTSSFQETPL